MNTSVIGSRVLHNCLCNNNNNNNRIYRLDPREAESPADADAGGDGGAGDALVPPTALRGRDNPVASADRPVPLFANTASASVLLPP